MKDSTDPHNPPSADSEPKVPSSTDPETQPGARANNGSPPTGGEVATTGAVPSGGGATSIPTALRLQIVRTFDWFDTSRGRSAATAAQVLSVILAGAALWIASVQLKSAAIDQAKARRYQAWQAISQHQGKPGNGGRTEALEDLNADSISLAGIDLTGGVALRQIRLPKAQLQGAHLAGAKLGGANLRGAHLEDVDLSDADLTRGDLRDAILKRSDLRRATLQGTRFGGVMLYRTDFRGANLRESDFGGATIQKGAVYFGGADLSGANLSAVKGLVRDHVLAASDWRGAKLPEDLQDLELPADATVQDLQRLKPSGQATPGTP